MHIKSRLDEDGKDIFDTHEILNKNEAFNIYFPKNLVHTYKGHTKEITSIDLYPKTD